MGVSCPSIEPYQLFSIFQFVFGRPCLSMYRFLLACLIVSTFKKSRLKRNIFFLIHINSNEPYFKCNFSKFPFSVQKNCETVFLCISSSSLFFFIPKNMWNLRKIFWLLSAMRNFSISLWSIYVFARTFTFCERVQCTRKEYVWRRLSRMM